MGPPTRELTTRKGTVIQHPYHHQQALEEGSERMRLEHTITTTTARVLQLERQVGVAQDTLANAQVAWEEAERGY